MPHLSYQKLLTVLGDFPSQELLHHLYMTGAILGYNMEPELVRVQVVMSLDGGEWLEKQKGMNWRYVTAYW